MTPHAISPPPSDGTVTPELTSSGDDSPNSESKSSRSVNSRSASLLPAADATELYDLICLGFGPASLAVAVALHDFIEAHPEASKPKVAFFEKQKTFAWHSGMQLPGATMQISWIKDFATLRNPRSHFTFLNYLHESKRLVRFANLGTFLPQRIEYEAYMKWAAAHFSHLVEYGQEGVEILPQYSSANEAGPDCVTHWLVRTRNLTTGAVQERRSRHVVLALGGRPSIPPCLPQSHPRVIHSSQYMNTVPSLFPDRNKAYNFAVIGSGQSSAETFHDLCSRFPEARVRLLIRGSALKPSDDSPFVNETFDPDHVDNVFHTDAALRHAGLLNEKATNYGVVRLELLERIYADMYEESVRYPDRRDEDLHARILPYRNVTGHMPLKGDRIRLQVENLESLYRDGVNSGRVTDEIDVDALIVAAGYDRNAHNTLLRPAEALMRKIPGEAKKWSVRRDYGVEFTEGAVSSNAGIWLQGCNEATHGLSDTLLSILSVRGGEIVDSIFSP